MNALIRVASEVSPVAAAAAGPLSDSGTAAGVARTAADDEMAVRRGAHAVKRIVALGEMTGGIAHDFRNILAMIGSALNLAERHGGDALKVRQYIASARESVDRGVELTSRLLSLARPDEGDIGTESLNLVLRDFLPFLRFGAGPGIAVRLVACRSQADCLVDPAQFKSALLNLVVNARDAMPRGGKIEIRTDAVRGACVDAAKGLVPAWLRVRVTDDGVGMSEPVLARIFDPWFTTKGEEGTGLGVPQVRAFMESVGGRLAVTSEPGIGTSFDLFFPLPDSGSGDPLLARQVDRWVNEGGSTGPGRA